MLLPQARRWTEDASVDLALPDSGEKMRLLPWRVEGVGPGRTQPTWIRRCTHRAITKRESKGRTLAEPKWGHSSATLGLLTTRKTGDATATATDSLAALPCT
ncbi:hypothetical protein L7F22_063561 [Adiantum nelumboides]|nr:hypothetical protein [Adiantum nelumboides]